jgi:tetratricopeptide (TPR) repeat protein
MKGRSTIAVIALFILFVALTGCQQQPAPPPPTPAPAPAPTPAPAPAPGTPAPAAPAPQQEAPKPQAAAPAAGEPSQEVKSHLKQGMSYVSVAKNANSAGIFNENIENAINEFSNAAKKDPGYAEAYSNRGVAYMMQKKYNKALDDLKKAKELKPESSSIRYNLASVHSLMGNVDYGLDELDASLSRGFSNYDVLRKDPDIAGLRKHKDYRKILEKHKVFIN